MEQMSDKPMVRAKNQSRPRKQGVLLYVGLPSKSVGIHLLSTEQLILRSVRQIAARGVVQSTPNSESPQPMLGCENK
jgi:hypothetical protein